MKRAETDELATHELTGRGLRATRQRVALLRLLRAANRRADGQIRGLTDVPEGFRVEHISVTLRGICARCRDEV